VKAKEYPEIAALAEINHKFKVAIEVINEKYLAGKDYYPAIRITLQNKSFDLFVDDEYEDLEMGNHLLSLCLVLRELEAYQDADDFLIWCKQNAFPPSNIEVQNYHRSLGAIYREVEKIIGKVDSKVSDYDFELNAGAAQALRGMK